METIKVKPEKSGVRTIGLIFTPLGSVLALLGLVLGFAVEPMLLVCFGCLGGLFLLIGIGCLIFSGLKTRKQQQAVDQGNYVWGTVQSFQQDMSVMVNGRCPYRVLVEVMGSDGVRNVYRSNANWKLSPLESFIGRQVKVYGPELQVPYVDLSSLEKNLVNHF